MATEPITRINYTHDAMIDLIIANPRITHQKLADAFGYSRTWVTNILSSDAFKARLAARRAEIMNPVLVASVEEQLEGLARTSIAALEEGLSKPNPDLNVAAKVLQTSTKALGMGQGEGPGRQPPSSLEKLADNITLVFREKRERVINGEATEIPKGERADASDNGEAD